VRRYWTKGEHAVALRQFKQALLCSLAPGVVARLACLVVLVIAERLAETSSHHAIYQSLAAGDPGAHLPDQSVLEQQAAVLERES
jgi:anti-sigma factor RsiW